MGKRSIEDVTGKSYPYQKEQTGDAVGRACEFARRKTKVNIILPDPVFHGLRESAINNNRSLSMEARTMIEAALKAQQKMEES